MKKYALSLFVILGLMGGSCLGQEVPQAESAKAPQGLFGREKAAWSKGIAAAKKRYWNRKRLSAQEKSYYNALLKRVGTVAGIMALIGAGTFIVKQQQQRQWQREQEEWRRRHAQDEALQAEGQRRQEQAEVREAGGRQQFEALLDQCEAGPFDENRANQCLNDIMRSPYASDDQGAERAANAIERIARLSLSLDFEQMESGSGETLLLSLMSRFRLLRNKEHLENAVIALLEAGANPNALDNEGKSLLVHAVLMDSEPLVRTISERMSRDMIDAVSRHGSALYLAVHIGHPNRAVIGMLLEAGANPDLEVQGLGMRETPRERAAARGLLGFFQQGSVGAMTKRAGTEE